MDGLESVATHELRLTEDPIAFGLIVGQLFGRSHASEVGLAADSGFCGRGFVVTVANLGIGTAATAVVLGTTVRRRGCWLLVGSAGQTCPQGDGLGTAIARHPALQFQV